MVHALLTLAFVIAVCVGWVAIMAFFAFMVSLLYGLLDDREEK